MKPTIFFEISSRYETNPLAMALKQVASAFGAEPVTELIQGDTEADIAVTNTVEAALRLVKETERTSVVLAYLRREEGEEAVALASRFPGRIVAVSYISIREGETEIVPFLQALIADMVRQAHHRKE